LTRLVTATFAMAASTTGPVKAGLCLAVCVAYLAVTSGT
jgi:hypothetical protein